MKSKILSTVLLFIMVAATVLLVQKFPQSDGTGSSVSPSETNEAVGETTEAQNNSPATGSAFVNATAHDAEKLIEQFAYGKDKSFDTSMADLVLRLDQAANYLKDEMQDYYGATYFAKLSDIFDQVITNPFRDTADFSERVSKVLIEIENSFPAETVENTQSESVYYPKFDTETSGAFSLAMLSVFRQQYLKSTGAILITVGGNTVFGDSLLGEDAENSFKKEQKASSYHYPLHKLSSVFGSDTATFVNLEAPLTESISESNAAGNVKGSPAYSSIFKNCSIEAVAISSPDISSFGDAGKDDTKKALSNDNVGFSDEGSVYTLETDIGKIALLSYDIIDEINTDVNQGFIEIPKQDIAAAKANGAKCVVVNFNWITKEQNSWDPCMAQVLSTRAAIENGASLVFGSHPNSIQSIEYYKGAYAVYSTGNLFKKGAEAATSFLFQLSFTLGENGQALPGDILVFPVTNSNGETDVPALALDAASGANLVNELTTVSRTVRYGLGKRSEFPTSSIKYIAIQK